MPDPELSVLHALFYWILVTTAKVGLIIHNITDEETGSEIKQFTEWHRVSEVAEICIRVKNPKVYAFNQNLNQPQDSNLRKWAGGREEGRTWAQTEKRGLACRSSGSVRTGRGRTLDTLVYSHYSQQEWKGSSPRSMSGVIFPPEKDSLVCMKNNVLSFS